MLRIDLGQLDGVNVAEELARDRCRAVMICPDSAAVKLAHAEPESATLRWLAGWLAGRAETWWGGSVLTQVEAFRHWPGTRSGAVSRGSKVSDQRDQRR